jgi:hypothetical protein
MINKNDVVVFLPEWSDPGDDKIVFTAIEDEDGGRVKVRAELGMVINPVQVVETRMIVCAS